jgi:recombination protein RecT
MKMATQQEVAKQASKQKVVTVYDFLEQKKDLIAKALPASITPDRLIGVFTMVLRSSPELAQCSQMSLISSVIQTVQLGLTPGNIGHCYYIPFNNKQKDGSYQKEVQFVIGYKGIVELVNRCGKASLLSTEIVYENDKFEHQMGLNPILNHVPTSGDRGSVAGVYCIAKNLVANEKVFVYLSKADIDKVRLSSKAGQSDYSPWAKWYEEMAKKTAVKRICKLLPLSVDDQRKVAQDETIKNEIQPDMASVKDDAQWDGDTIEAGEELATPGHPAAENVSHETPAVDDRKEDVTPLPEEDRSKFISEKQRKRMFAISKSAGWSSEDVSEYLKEIHNIDSRNDVPWGKTYDEICSFIEDNPKNG